jgi:hypothetical protein
MIASVFPVCSQSCSQLCSRFKSFVLLLVPSVPSVCVYARVQDDCGEVLEPYWEHGNSGNTEANR